MNRLNRIIVGLGLLVSLYSAVSALRAGQSQSLLLGKQRAISSLPLSKENYKDILHKKSGVVP